MPSSDFIGISKSPFISRSVPCKAVILNLTMWSPGSVAISSTNSPGILSGSSPNCIGTASNPRCTIISVSVTRGSSIYPFA